MGTKKPDLKSSFDDIESTIDDFFDEMGSKHCNTDERSVWTVRGDYIEK